MYAAMALAGAALGLLLVLGLLPPMSVWSGNSVAALSHNPDRSSSMIFEALATICAGLFAGASVYITFVEHPARLECGTELAATEFGPSYRRASWMQVSLAVAGFLAALVASFPGRVLPVLLGGVLLGGVIPFTLLVILPTNQRLLSAGLDRASAEAAGLLTRWGRLHAVRSVMGVVAFGILVWHLAGTD